MFMLLRAWLMLMNLWCWVSFSSLGRVVVVPRVLRVLRMWPSLGCVGRLWSKSRGWKYIMR